jgi:hypothetical protein
MPLTLLQLLRVGSKYGRGLVAPARIVCQLWNLRSIPSVEPDSIAARAEDLVLAVAVDIPCCQRVGAFVFDGAGEAGQQRPVRGPGQNLPAIGRDHFEEPIADNVGRER